MQSTIARRLRVIRKQRGLTRAQVAGLLGLPGARAVSAIEAGTRRLTADELLRATVALDVGLDWLTDAFAVDGEATFSWLVDGAVDPIELDSLELRAGRLVGAVRAMWQLLDGDFDIDFRVGAAQGHRPTVLPGDPAAHGARLAREIDRGGDGWLATGIECALGLPVLHIDAAAGVTCGICRLDEMDGIFVNRKVPAAARNHGLALMAYLSGRRDVALPPRVLASSADASLADAETFAGNLLLPDEVLVTAGGPQRGARLPSWLSQSAARLQVPAATLAGRLVERGLLERSEADAALCVIPAEASGTAGAVGEPRPFGAMFMGILWAGSHEGRISVRRSASLCGLDVDSYKDLLGLWGHGAPGI
jgi:transcriptional regulator with XRE-family HTH domain